MTPSTVLVPAASPADAVAAAVVACPNVARLSGGALGEVATYLPGRRVLGVRVDDDAVQVHIVGRYGPTVDEIAAEVRAAVRAVLGARPVAVGVDDLDVSGAGVPAAASPPGP